MLTKYFVIALVVMGIALAGSLYLLKQSYARNGALEATIVSNAAAYKVAIDEANAAITELRLKREEDQEMILDQARENTEIRAEFDADRRRLDQWRTTLKDRTLAKPKVTERAARMALRRQACETWHITGGVGECPK